MLLRNDIIKRLEDVETVPPTATMLVKAVADSNYDIDEVARIIKYDPSLTANILRAVNSPFFGRIDKVRTIEESIVVLGSKDVLKIALTAALRMMQEKPVAGYGLKSGELWKHSIETAVAASIIASEKDFENPEIYFTAGMLHDIGKIIMGDFVGAKSDEILAEVKAGLSFRDAERKVLGIDHSELGGMAVDNWEFPEMLTEAVKYYHKPDKYPAEGPYLRQVYTVHAADYICMKSGKYSGIDGGLYGAYAPAMEFLGLDDAAIAKISALTAESYKKIAAELGLEKEG